MSKEKSDEQLLVELIWLEFFQRLKLNHPQSLVVFLTVLGDFVRKFPADAGHLTIETLYGILLEEI